MNESTPIPHAIVVRDFQEQGFRETHLEPGQGIIFLDTGEDLPCTQETIKELQDAHLQHIELQALHFKPPDEGLYFASPILNNSGAIGADNYQESPLFPIRVSKSKFIVGWAPSKEELRDTIDKQVVSGNTMLTRRN